MPGNKLEMHLPKQKGRNMTRNQKQGPASRLIILMLVFGTVISVKEGYIGNEKWYWILIVTVPLLLLAMVNGRREKHDESVND